uniref:CCHC-type domain-containing protein n=1 Tax=Tanacetum cinerariifolium TaxID=118510 RepID=A0A6L2JGK0_TANCI|nr:hypothetical protein [Tanacetum cinerariifolium]
MSTPTFAETHNLVSFLEKPSESEGFEQIVDFLNAKPIIYALMVNPTVYALCVKQFWTTAKVKKVNDQEQIQALVDKQKVEGMAKHKEIYVMSSHTKNIFANIRRQGQGFSGNVTPLFKTMMVIAQEEKKMKPKRKQRQAAEVHSPSCEIPVEESIPTPFNDPLPSGEDSIQLNELMIFYTSLQQQVLDLQEAKEIAKLKKRVKKLEKRRKSRPVGMRRLKKVGKQVNEWNSLRNKIVYDTDPDITTQVEDNLEYWPRFVLLFVDPHQVVPAPRFIRMSGRDHRQQNRRFATRGNGYEARDPRDAEIERLRQRIHELETNPFDRSPRVQPQQQVDHLRSLGLRTDIPEFKGRLQPDDFLDWIQTVERIFDLRDIPDHLKGSLPVEELIHEFERMRMRCGADGDEKQVIACFLSILRRDITNVVMLQQYYSFDDVCRLALRVEQQLNNKLKPLTKFSTTSRPPTSAPRVGPINTEPPVIPTNQTRTSNALRCFKCQGLGHLKRDCLNKQILSFVDEPEPTYDTEEEEEEPTEVLYHDRGEILVSRRVLNVILSDHGDDTTWLRNNILRTQCTSKGKVCMIIVDGESCENMVATVMVEKLSLPTQKHPDPYKLTWLKKGNLVHDTHRCLDGLNITLASLNPRDEPQQPLTKRDFVGLTKQPTTTHVLALVVVEANPKPLECPAAVLSLLREFIYNRSTHSSTGRSPFLLVYGRNPFTPFDLAPLAGVTQYNAEGSDREKQIKLLHEHVSDQNTKHNLQYQARANKHRQKVVFQVGDLVWIFLRRVRFPQGHFVKLQPRADSTFRVLERINNNAYKIDLPGHYGVSATFNVADLAPYVGDEPIDDDSETSAQEDASKQGRNIEDIDLDAEIALVDESHGRMQDADMFRVDDLVGNKVFIEKSVEKEVSTADLVTTAGEVVAAASVEDSAAPTTATTADVDDKLTLEKTLIAIKATKPKVIPTAITTLRAKGIVFHEQVQAHKLTVSRKLEGEMRAEIEEGERIAREKDKANRVVIKEWDDVQATIDADRQRKYLAAKRAKEIKNKPPTKAHQRNTENVEESLKKDEAESGSKRVGQELEQESAKKQKLVEQEHDKVADDDTTELKRCLEIILEEYDDIAIEATPLSSKSSTIVDYKIYREGKKSYFKIIRAYGNSQNYLNFGTMFKNFNKEDLEVLRSIVKERFKKTKPVDYIKNLLFQTLKTMFEPHVEDIIWKYQQGAVKVNNWKLFDSCGVYYVTTKTMVYYLLVEKMYPFTNSILHQLWSDVRL